MNSFEIQWDISKKSPVIFLKGDITADSSDKIHAAYYEVKKAVSSNTLIFDFHKSKYINSSGISSLIKHMHSHHETNGKFIFTGLTDHTIKVLDIEG